MTNIFDDAAEAMLALLTTRCGGAFKSYKRGVLLYDDVIQLLTNPPAGGPGMTFPQLWYYEGVGLGGGTISYERQTPNTPPKRTMSHTIVIYALKDGANTPAGANNTQPGNVILNPLFSVVESAFAPDKPSFNRLTLGGLVSHCWIEGDVYTIPGDIDPSGLAMQTVPVKILVP